MTPKEALALLKELGAPPRLQTHHVLVLEAAEELLDGWPVELSLKRELVLCGAALHDAGKIRFPEEMSGPGSQHEAAGEELLLTVDVPKEIARLCRSHAQWNTMEISLEELVVALADKLWKGKRDEVLEKLALTRISQALQKPAWEIFCLLDPLFEKIASKGEQRLARSR